MEEIYLTSIPDEDVPPDPKRSTAQKTDPEVAAIKQSPLEIHQQPTKQQSGTKILPLVILIIACGLTIIAALLLVA